MRSYKKLTPCIGRDVALADGVFYQTGGLPDVELSHDIGTVIFCGSDAYKEEDRQSLLGLHVEAGHSSITK